MESIGNARMNECFSTARAPGPKRQTQTKAQALVVAGMHRSGTSLTAGILEQLGIDMGQRLIPANSTNPRGFYEDTQIVAFHQQAFRCLLPRNASGHIDWGWCEKHALDTTRLEGFRPAARRLVAERESQGVAWGFKDPRTTLLLDFWDSCIDDARYVMVYRAPWQVADSMQRLQAEVFLNHPGYAYHIWQEYNQHLLDFFLRNRDRCVLINVDALRYELPRFQKLLMDKLRLKLTDVDLSGAFDEDLLGRADSNDPRADLTALAFPECQSLLEQLDLVADLTDERSAERSAPQAIPASIHGDRVVKSSNPEVSIVIPTYNDAIYLIDSLASVEKCQIDDAEVIIVDDGTEDEESRRILQTLKERGYHIITQENRGLSAARNTGIANSRGRFILPLDADNRLCAGFIKAALEAFAAGPDLGVVYTDRQLFGKQTGTVHVPDFNLQKLLFGNYIDACAMFRRELWNDLIGYDERLPCWEDWEFWIRAGVHGWSFQHLNRIGFEYRVRTGSLNDRYPTLVARQKLRQRILRNHRQTLFEGLPGRVGAVIHRVERALPDSWKGFWKWVTTNGYWLLFWEAHGLGGLLTWPWVRKPWTTRLWRL